MKLQVYSSLALAVVVLPAFLSTADAFAPQLRLPASARQPHLRRQSGPRRVLNFARMDYRDMDYRDDVSQPRDVAAEDARSIALRASLPFGNTASAVMPDKGYVGFVDAAGGFDGG
eukprot:CAMPEP_0181295912 /NCGR_PEP_ID=MMETSP1101-20121128/4407_1 /TAXON_ID=46948 /ORGANISM="Rhodomonas abbreviata, Strain Caron Lab Isolate" /LENGTH=115 /DNA_ID=CAMNT_0023400709 /DNA_START=129 /DNA_END=472 /DNA_ORIENTATION=+